MKQRIHQFFWALFGRIDSSGHLFVRAYLHSAERKLFYAMHAADQYHAFRVAVTAHEIYTRQGRSDSDEYILLMRCALLHDIGRVKGSADIWGKVLAVLVDHFFPFVIPYFLRRKNTNDVYGRIKTALYIHIAHPYIGAEKLRRLGDIREAEIVQQHQKKAAPEDSPVLSILKLADAQN